MSLPVSIKAHVDGMLLLSTFIISLISSLLFGILPALRASAAPPAEVLKEETDHDSGGRRKMRLMNAIVVAQLAISLVLMVFAAIFVLTFRQMQRIYPGFNPKGVLVTSIDLFAAGYSEERGIEFERDALARIQTLPGVQSATLANGEPMRLLLSGVGVKPESYVPRIHESMEIDSSIVAPDYFRTMQIPLKLGREFAFSDTPQSQQVAILNEVMAAKYWPNQNPLGKRIQIGGRWMSIVGIARNSNYLSLNEAPRPHVYLPAFQDYSPKVVFHVRSLTYELAVAPGVEAMIHGLNPELPVFDVATLSSRLEVYRASQRLAGTMTGAFGLIALALTIVGIYGVIAFAVRQRQYEIGLRIAMGAKKWDVLWLVLREGMLLSSTGVVIGLALVFALTKVLNSFLPSLDTTDLLTFIGVALLEVTVSLAACYIPARHASTISPMTLLRHL